MKVTLRRWGAALLAGAAVFGASAPAAHAQPIVRPSVVNPAFTTAPGIQMYSNLYNAAILGRTIRQIPPWVYGYNPYPSPIISGGGYGGMPYYPPYYGSPVMSTYPGAGAGYGGSATLTTNPYGYDASLYNSGGYGGYGGYGDQGYNPYGAYDPSYGFLRGSADIIHENGEFLKNQQVARMYQTQADSARVDYRRKLIDEARYERGLLPTTEEMRQADIRRDLDRARRQPPISEIISAKALNDILEHLRSDPAVTKGQEVRIPDGVLERINVTNPTATGASLGLLKEEGKLQWPAPLAGREFEGPRADLSRRMEDVVQDLKFSNPVQQGKINDLKADLEKLRNLVNTSELSPTDYIEARTYLDKVSSAIQALGQQNVAALFNHKFSARNVAELVDGMRGLDFAPAAPGDEWAYKLLHQALVNFDASASPHHEAPPPPPPPPPANPPVPAPKPPY
jgi:hypothetical protein